MCNKQRHDNFLSHQYRSLDCAGLGLSFCADQLHLLEGPIRYFGREQSGSTSGLGSNKVLKLRDCTTSNLKSVVLLSHMLLESINGGLGLSCSTSFCYKSSNYFLG